MGYKGSAELNLWGLNTSKMTLFFIHTFYVTLLVLANMLLCSEKKLKQFNIKKLLDNPSLQFKFWFNKLKFWSSRSLWRMFLLCKPIRGKEGEYVTHGFKTCNTAERCSAGWPIMPHAVLMIINFEPPAVLMILWFFMSLQLLWSFCRSKRYREKQTNAGQWIIGHITLDNVWELFCIHTTHNE